MIKKRYIFISLAVLLIGVLVIALAAYFFFSRRDDDSEMVFAATEVGTPVGDKVTKQIGTAGGTLASPDGRLTLTVPQNALTETVTFGIQPVTNKFEMGLGLAYKLEPDTMAFTTPLDITVLYDDSDLEGTFPEALSLGYQDEKGAWHMQRDVDLDKEKRTISVSTRHFSTWSSSTMLKLSPAKATVRVGESVSFLLIKCYEDSFFSIDYWIRGRDHYKCYPITDVTSWSLKGAGELQERRFYGSLPGNEHIYTAPGKKPTPNVATVLVDEFESVVFVERPCTNADGGLGGKNAQKWIIPKKCYSRVKGPASAVAEITIVDRGYRASGNAGGDTVFSGVICDLEKPFTLKTSNPFLAGFDFTPSSPIAGTWKFATKNGVAGGGHGKYTIEGSDAVKTGIVMSGDSTGCILGGCRSGSGDVRLTLTPLTGNECGG